MKSGQDQRKRWKSIQLSRPDAGEGVQHYFRLSRAQFVNLLTRIGAASHTRKPTIGAQFQLKNSLYVYAPYAPQTLDISKAQRKMRETCHRSWSHLSILKIVVTMEGLLLKEIRTSFDKIWMMLGRLLWKRVYMTGQLIWFPGRLCSFKQIARMLSPRL
ncbi:hypothetical protein XENOCAPTIV_002953 [Xenoophorus captivus]|uniref:Uncharacterized protein n=1 Tax=Xenoophorus captivus TaxID=1517983 RepID=A0ABV0QY54_9TELE